MTINRELIERRLQELETELQKGDEQLKALQLRQTEIRTTMLRLSGAVQVVKELLDGVDEVRQVATDQPKVAAAG